MKALTRLPAMRYRFTAELDQPLRLPAYPGSMLRGAFGHALQKLGCPHSPTECDRQCAHTPCRYRRIFSPCANGELSISIAGQLPPPYLISPLNWPCQQPVTELEFNMVLFGSARNELMLIVQSWQTALANGLGKAKVKGRLCKVVAELPQDEQTVYEQGKLRIEPHQQHYAIPAFNNEKRVQLVFNSPLRLQQNGRPVAAHALSPNRFVSALLRRLTLMLEAHAVAHPISAKELLQHADTISHQHTLSWFDWQRYSSRQKKEMVLGGLLGSWHWQGDLEALWPYLWAGQIVHVGKETVFGMGKYQLLAS